MPLDDPFAGSIPSGGAAPTTGAANTYDDPFAGSIPTGAPIDPNDQQQQASPAANLGWSDIFDQFKKGAGRAYGDITGQETAPPEGAAPFEWSDILHPGRGAAKFAERTGESWPEVGPGLVGSAAGTALAGPVGGIIAGGGLAAAGAFAHQIRPFMKSELARTPDDPEGAFNRALTQAALGGGATGLAWGMFPAKFFAGPVKNAVFQALGVQPGIQVARQAAQNVAGGEDATKGLGEAYTEGAVGSAVPMFTNRLASGLGKKLGIGPVGEAPPEPMTPKDIHDETNNRYGEIRKLNITYPNHGELTGLRDEIRKELVDKGYDPDLAPDSSVFNAVDKLAKPREGNQSVDFTDIDRSRRMLGNIWARSLKNGDDPTRAAAGVARTAINEWLSNPDRQTAAGVDPNVAQNLSAMVTQARQWSRADRAAHAWDVTTELSKTAKDPEKYLRDAMKKIVDARIKLGGAEGKSGGASGEYPKEVVDLMQEMLKPGMWNVIARNPGMRLFNPHSPLSWMMDMLLHSAHGMSGAAPVVGMQALEGLAQHFAERPIREAPGKVAGAINQFPPGAPQPAPQPTMMQRTLRGYSPYRSPPILPGGDMSQQGYQEGGNVDPPIGDFDEALDPEAQLLPNYPNVPDDALMGAPFAPQQMQKPLINPGLADFDEALDPQPQLTGGAYGSPDPILMDPNPTPRPDIAAMNAPMPRARPPVPMAAPGQGKGAPAPYAAPGVGGKGAGHAAVRMAHRHRRRYDDGGSDDQSSDVDVAGISDADQAQAAREAAAATMQRAVGPSPTQPQDIPERLQNWGNYGAAAWNDIKQPFEDLVQHPEDIVGTEGLRSAAAPALGMFFKPNRMEQLAATAGEGAGQTNDQIWDRLNMFRDAAGNWRKEILGPMDPKISLTKPADTTWGAAMNAPHILKRQPEVGSTPLKISGSAPGYNPDNPKVLGLYEGQVKGIPGREQSKIWLRSGSEYGDPFDSLVHETQHLLDHYAGTLGTTSPNWDWYREGLKGNHTPEFQAYLDKLSENYGGGRASPQKVANAIKSDLVNNSVPPDWHDEAYKVGEHTAYMNLMHEAMARLAEKRETQFQMLRQMYSPGYAQSALKDIIPTAQYDVPKKTQTVSKYNMSKIRKANGGAAKKALAVARRAA